MDTPQLIVAILGAGGGGAALLAIVTGIIKWASGTSSRERVRATDLRTQRINAVRDRNKAEDDRDESDRRRRYAYEYASALRRQLTEAGIEPLEWPRMSTNGPTGDVEGEYSRTHISRRYKDDE